MDRIRPASGLPPDPQLAARIARGDSAAEDEFVRTFARPIRHLLRHRLPSAEGIDDLCQDALCAALLHLRHDDLRARDRLAAYVWGIARNLARAHTRRSREQVAAAALDPPDPGGDPERPLRAREDHERLANCIAILAPRDRELLAGLLREEDKPAACARLGVSASGYDVAKFRALQRLRRAWGADQRSGRP
jgi:RNA polymerase sigma factor (sigma-70 family)